MESDNTKDHKAVQDVDYSDSANNCPAGLEIYSTIRHVASCMLLQAVRRLLTQNSSQSKWQRIGLYFVVKRGVFNVFSTSGNWIRVSQRTVGESCAVASYFMAAANAGFYGQYVLMPYSCSHPTRRDC